MAQILCDCGCGKSREKRFFFSDSCRKRFVRNPGQSVRKGGQDVRKSGQSIPPEVIPVRQDGHKKDNPPSGTFSENIYGKWTDGVWVPNVVTE